LAAASASSGLLLRYKADRRTVAFFVAHFAMIAAAYKYARGPWVFLAIALISYSSFIELISGHNAMHAPIFHNRTLNRIWQMLLSLTFCYPVSAFVPVHNMSHHMHLQTPKDVLRTTEVRHKSNLLNLLHHVLQAAAHIHILNAVYLTRVRTKKRAWFEQVRNEILGVLVVDSVLIYISPRSYLLFVFVPALIGQGMIFGFGYLQHDGTDAESDFNHSRNFLGPFYNFLIFDNGYHTIHHNKPGTHWSLGPEGHRREVVGKMDPALDRYSVIVWMWEAYLSPGKRQRYDGKPVELPLERSQRDLWIPTGAVTAGASSGAVEG
jgi:fatty acid desaturase